jgi:uncharacterized repeat protein (TIGR03803 family)
MFGISNISGKCLVGGALALTALMPLDTALAKSAETVLYDFTGKSGGSNPNGALVMDGSGNLYGTASTGANKGCSNSKHGKNSCGTIFKLTSKGKESALYAFKGGKDGGDPVGGLVADSSGNFYGVTGFGGGSQKDCNKGCGTVFKVTPGGTETTLHAFTSGSDGNGPVAGVIVDGSGNLFGTTLQGGSNDRCGGTDAHGCGIVFKLASGGAESVLHVFTGASDGAFPAASLLEDGVGNLYGTTGAGGSTNTCGTAWQGCGTVFEIAANGTESVLHAFTGSDGAYPAGSLIADGSGNLYGVTTAGGSSDDCGEGPYGCGTLFKLAANGTETILHVFAGGSDGAYPLPGLYADGAGDLFGTTGAGGSTDTCGKLGLLPNASGCGVVFEFAANGTESVLHVFTGKKNDGAYPAGILTADGAGNLYGTTFGGGTKGCSGPVGSAGCGTVFKIKK